jgi:hypothetical protein
MNMQNNRKSVHVGNVSIIGPPNLERKLKRGHCIQLPSFVQLWINPWKALNPIPDEEYPKNPPTREWEDIEEPNTPLQEEGDGFDFDRKEENQEFPKREEDDELDPGTALLEEEKVIEEEEEEYLRVDSNPDLEDPYRPDF